MFVDLQYVVDWLSVMCVFQEILLPFCVSVSEVEKGANFLILV